MGLANMGEKQSEIIVNLCYGANRGPWIARSGFLLDGYSRGQAFNGVHIRFFHEAQKLPGVGG